MIHVEKSPREILMSQECAVCLNNCVIPVQLKCFECYDERKLNCNSLKRICLACYIDMDEQIQKCFYCSGRKISNTIAIDFQMIQQDEVSLLSCPYCNISGLGHVALYKHVMKNHIRDCDCGAFVFDEKKHYKYCDKKYWCEKCSKFQKSCVHQKCRHCHKRCDHPPEKCMERPFRCPQCDEIFTAKTFMNHFMEHLNDNRTIQKALQNSIQTHKREYKTLMTLLPQLYKEVYHENME